MTPGEAYWASRGIELGAIMAHDDPRVLPGTPVLTGHAEVISEQPVVKHYHHHGVRPRVYRNVDDWQPVNTQAQMF